MRKYMLLISVLYIFFIGCIEDPPCCPPVDETDNRDTTGVKTSTLGFLPSNPADENSTIFQNIINTHDTVFVDMPGVYDLDTVMLLDDNTRIIFNKGVYIRKQRNKNGIAPEYVFINKGAYTRVRNENIELNGLNLICNGLDDNYGKIQGLVGHVSFFCVSNLTIKNFTCNDMLRARFCIQIAEFKNILVENVSIHGDKDGIHLGAGNGFVIRNGIFRTADDPIALNAHDYDISNPTVGWIENGLIENCYDLPYPVGEYHFCRILAGSWVDWFAGMELQKSDIVVNNDRLYRVVAPTDGKIYTSHTAPDHASGYKVIDGINWYMMQEGAIYSAGCRNVHFKDIYLNRTRSSALRFHFDMDKWSRSYYPGSTAPVQDNFTFENIHTEGDITMLIYAMTPVDNIKFINSKWSIGSIQFNVTVAYNYPPANITLDNIHFIPGPGMGISDSNNNREVILNIKNSTVNNKDWKLALHGNVTVTASDIPYYFMKP